MTPTLHDACEGTGWYTVVDLDGAYIEPCSRCNPDGMVIAMPEPSDELRTQILAAIHGDLQEESRRFTKGLLIGLAISAPIWFVIVLVIMAVLS